MTKAKDRSPSQPCVFPFRIKTGNWHNSCTNEQEEDKNKFWCATKTTNRGELISGQWGYCEDSCFRTG